MMHVVVLHGHSRNLDILCILVAIVKNFTQFQLTNVYTDILYLSSHYKNFHIKMLCIILMQISQKYLERYCLWAVP